MRVGGKPRRVDEVRERGLERPLVADGLIARRGETNGGDLEARAVGGERVQEDDDLLERYLEGESLSDDELNTALRRGTLERLFVPVMCGSATKNIGIDLLQDFVIQCMPSPIGRGTWTAIDPSNESEVECNPDPDEPFSAFIFKTVADPFAGRLSIFRVVSGSIGSGSFTYIKRT